MIITHLLATLLASVLPGPDLEYDLTLTVENPADQSVRGLARLRGLDGPIELALPEAYAYSRLPEPRLLDLPRASEGRSIERLGPYRWRLDPGLSSEAEVRWTMALDQREQPGAEGDQFEHPYVDVDHGMLVPAALALAPDRPMPTRVRFEVPGGWDVIAPWARSEDGAWLPEPGRLHQDLVAIGHWDVERSEISGMQMTLAFAPGQAELFARVREDLPPIVELELELFGGAVQPHYLFLFGRPDQKSGYGGSPKNASMALFASPDLPPDFAAVGVRHLMAHEFHHTWMKACCRPEDELRFVMEGFTDYYASIVPWRLLMTDDAGLVQAFSDHLARAETSLEKWGGTLLAAGGPEFFGGGPPYDACYAAGLVQALWLDLALRQRDTDLDVFLRGFYNDPRWQDGTQPGLEDWLVLVREALGGELADKHAAALQAEGGPDLVELFGLVDLELRRRGGPKYVVPSDLPLRLE